MGLGISSKYLGSNRRSTPSLDNKMETTQSGYIRKSAIVKQGGGKPSYFLSTFGVVFSSSDGGSYSADIPTRYEKNFFTGATFSIGCGCGGGKKTILQII